MIDGDQLGGRLLSPTEAERLDAHGHTEAAVLVALYGEIDNPTVIYTERRHDLNRHAGEISFPGGRRDPGEDLLETALREAEEEIDLRRHNLSVVGALPPIATFVTNYKVHPYVAIVTEPTPPLTASPSEVERILRFSTAELRTARGVKRLVRRGIPFKTDVFELDGALIWGATARITVELLDRLARTGVAD